ncbi:hypothetical protein RRG08_063898 [Elysia crispata]|uniref:Uncharacterized protein n=1 Tax=Elysia crispata TaxID=231223 RepID=A0AAE1DRU7_9GAST|nr:hypothetical protein RRG08_063898 [Elysia crispata]
MQRTIQFAKLKEIDCGTGKLLVAAGWITIGTAERAKYIWSNEAKHYVTIMCKLKRLNFLSMLLILAAACNKCAESLISRGSLQTTSSRPSNVIPQKVTFAPPGTIKYDFFWHT